jgi:hypothetical protein
MEKKNHFVIINGKQFKRRSYIDYTHVLVKVGPYGVRIAHWYRSLKYQRRYERHHSKEGSHLLTVPVGSIVETSAPNVWMKPTGYVPGKGYGMYIQDDMDESLGTMFNKWDLVAGQYNRTITLRDGTEISQDVNVPYPDVLRDMFGYVSPPNDIRIVGSL